ncbi:MAG: hypothetical protein VCD00_10340 [Candidatus Hydrogenedentota bacterium]
MDIKIGRSAHACAQCEADFVHESNIQSLVRILEGEFIRADYCAACWDSEMAETAYSTWTAQYYDPKVAEQEPEEAYSPLRQTFYAAAEKTTREDMSVAYLAAQLLRRQKVFRLIKETKDPDTDISLILFNDRIGNRLIEVSDPSLSHAELDIARCVLMEILNALETPEETDDDTGEKDETIENNPSTDAQNESDTHATSQETAQIQ